MSNPPVNDLVFNCYWLSERAITIEFGHQISESLLHRITGFNNLLQANPFAGYCTTVQAYTTLTVFFDPFKVSKSHGLSGNNCFEKVSAYLNALYTRAECWQEETSPVITIPVLYGGKYGPDLAEVAASHQLSPQQVINLHAAATYKVYMTGFVPGFAYLGGMDERLATPRKAAPRKAVAAGSVGIAGQQTGIYPLETPGGWQIIGRTPLKLFDAGRIKPALLKAGDTVIFKPVNQDEFDQLTGS